MGVIESPAPKRYTRAMSEHNLKKAYSSKLSLVERNGKKYVKKEIGREETNNEVFFFRALREAGLPSLETIEEEDGLLVEFIESATLQEGKTLDIYRMYGALVRKMHDITFPTSFRINEAGAQEPLSWPFFIKKEIEEGLQRQEERNGFSKAVAETMAREINDRLSADPLDQASLLHCDLHENNVLIHNETLFLIDKGSAIAAGDPRYDLAFIGITFSEVLMHGTGPTAHFFDAFLEGYGSDFTKDRRRFDGYVLLRALGRWPNPFEPNIPNVVSKILGERV